MDDFAGIELTDDEPKSIDSLEVLVSNSLNGSNLQEDNNEDERLKIDSPNKSLNNSIGDLIEITQTLPNQNCPQDEPPNNNISLKEFSRDKNKEIDDNITISDSLLQIPSPEQFQQNESTNSQNPNNAPNSIKQPIVARISPHYKSQRINNQQNGSILQHFDQTIYSDYDNIQPESNNSNQQIELIDPHPISLELIPSSHMPIQPHPSNEMIEQKQISHAHEADQVNWEVKKPEKHVRMLEPPDPKKFLNNVVDEEPVPIANTDDELNDSFSARRRRQSKDEHENNDELLIDVTDIPISNNRTTNQQSKHSEIYDLQPTPQWVVVILSYIKNLISLQPSIAIHRSKLFALYDSFRQLERNFHPDMTLPISALKANCCSLIDSINKARQIVYSCSASHWGQSAITWPASTIKDSVHRLREDINECISLFNCREPRPNFLITDSQLEAQDSVDKLQLKGSLLEYLNRISQQPPTPQIGQITELIKERLNSIGPIEGIQEGPALLHITPFLPSYLNLVLTKDDFIMGQKIGSGTFGSVYKGVLKKNMTPIAIKMLNAHLLGGRQLETFKREVWTMANFNHPSILHLYGVTLTAPFCIITELLKCSLYDKLTVLTPTKRSVIALRVSQAMEQLHSARIIHRDLKSANILLDDDDMPRVCDFGLVGFKKRGTKTGYVGTAQWMAPEILRSSPFYDEKVDVYSFAVMLWEMLAQKQPYGNMTQDQMVMAILEKGLRPEILPEYGPPGLIDLIKVCWNEKPSERPSFSQISVALLKMECHFLGTDEQEFQRLVPKQLLSAKIVHEFDCCNWAALDQLLLEITPEKCKDDPELINTVITLFPNLDDPRKSSIVRNLPSMVDVEQFLCLKGYSFIVSLFSMNPIVIDATVQILRTIPLTSKGFRQVKLISCLSHSKNESTLELLRDLCQYEDIAKQVADHDIPFESVKGQEILLLRIYKNILNFHDIRSKVAECQQPISLAAVALHDEPVEVCQCLINYPLLMTDADLILALGLIPIFADVADKTELALKILSNIFVICPLDSLADYKEIIDELIQKYKQFFINENIYLKLTSLEAISQPSSHGSIALKQNDSEDFLDPSLQ